MVYWKKINNPKSQICVYLRKNLFSIIFFVLALSLYIFKLPNWINLLGFSKTFSIVISSILGFVIGIFCVDLFVKVVEDVNWLRYKSKKANINLHKSISASYMLDDSFGDFYEFKAMYDNNDALVSLHYYNELLFSEGFSPFVKSNFKNMFDFSNKRNFEGFLRYLSTYFKDESNIELVRKMWVDKDEFTVFLLNEAFSGKAYGTLFQQYLIGCISIDGRYCLSKLMYLKFKSSTEESQNGIQSFGQVN